MGEGNCTLGRPATTTRQNSDANVTIITLFVVVDQLEYFSNQQFPRPGAAGTKINPPGFDDAELWRNVIASMEAVH